jgi:tRNA pseudouridine55 synthase
MGRRRKGRDISGILVLDKPQGVSSNGALQRAKRLFQAAKAGHTGSLDPLATGVLPLCFGEATKFSQYLLDADKGYRSTFALGEGSDTGDAEGDIVRRASAAAITEADIRNAMVGLTGDIEQIPPMYSAVKRDGKPLYKLAREGKEVERAPRAVTIHQFDLLSFEPGDVARIVVDVLCSKGTYIRTLAEDLGTALGVPAHVGALRRTQSGPFSLDAAVTLEQLEADAEQGTASLDARLLPAEDAITDMPFVELTESAGFYLQQGQPVLVPNGPRDGMVRIVVRGGRFLGIGEMLDDGRVAPRRLIAN